MYYNLFINYQTKTWFGFGKIILIKLRLIAITHYCDYLTKEIYMHINRGSFLMKIGKRLSPLGKNKTKTNNRLGVAGACPAVVNSACVVVVFAVHPVAAASKQIYPSIMHIEYHLGALCAVHFVVAPGA
jgi:hypothetical protein